MENRTTHRINLAEIPERVLSKLITTFIVRPLLSLGDLLDRKQSSLDRLGRIINNLRSISK